MMVLGSGAKRLCLAIVLLCALPFAATAQDEKTIMLVPGASENLMGVIARVMQPGLERALDKPVEVATVIGESGGLAQDLLGRTPPDGSTLLVAELLTREIDEAMPDSGQETMLTQLTPILKLAQGISVALIVRKDSPFQDFASLAKEAKVRTLAVSTSGKRSSSGVALAMLAKRLDLPFAFASRPELNAILRDLDAGVVDAAIVFTRVLAFPEFKDHYRALVTFGADRSPLLRNEVPTLAELSGDRHDSFTTSIALFGPPAMDPEKVASLSAAFFRGVSSDSAVMETAVANGVDIVLKESDVVEETMERDQRVVERVLPLLQ